MWDGLVPLTRGEALVNERVIRCNDKWSGVICRGWGIEIGLEEGVGMSGVDMIAVPIPRGMIGIVVSLCLPPKGIEV